VETLLAGGTPGGRRRLPMAGAALLALLAGAAHADSALMAVSAVVPSKNNCKFDANSLALGFGTIDQLTATPLQQTGTITFTCKGSSALAAFAITADNGLNATGPGQRRMANLTSPGNFLPYGLSLSTTAGTAPKNVPQNLTVTITLQQSHFQSAAVGSYQDTVVLTVDP
jgi:spore coat protein U-like protein